MHKLLWRILGRKFLADLHEIDYYLDMMVSMQSTLRTFCDQDAVDSANCSVVINTEQGTIILKDRDDEKIHQAIMEGINNIHVDRFGYDRFLDYEHRRSRSRGNKDQLTLSTTLHVPSEAYRARVIYEGMAHHELFTAGSEIIYVENMRSPDPKTEW